MTNSEERGRQASVDGFAHEHIVDCVPKTLHAWIVKGRGTN